MVLNWWKTAAAVVVPCACQAQTAVSNEQRVVNDHAYAPNAVSNTHTIGDRIFRKYIIYNIYTI